MVLISAALLILNQALPTHAWLLVQALLRSGTCQKSCSSSPGATSASSSCSVVVSWINMVNLNQEVMRRNERQMDTREERAETKWR